MNDLFTGIHTPKYYQEHFLVDVDDNLYTYKPIEIFLGPEINYKHTHFQAISMIVYPSNLWVGGYLHKAKGDNQPNLHCKMMLTEQNSLSKISSMCMIASLMKFLRRKGINGELT